MIVYHGTPIGGERHGAAKFLRGRHALIPWPRPEDAAVAASVCQTFVIDNGAFSLWKSGNACEDWGPYFEFVQHWSAHPAFAWALIPDVIDGTEAENDALLVEWGNWFIPINRNHSGVPVWHLHESIGRLKNLCNHWPRVALGSSGDFPTPGAMKWWRRMREAMDAVCDSDGRPPCKFHGLRMAAHEYTSKFPFASVDSTNVAQNCSLLPRFGTYVPPNRWQRAEVIAWDMESAPTCAIFDRKVFYAGYEGDQSLFQKAN